MRSLAMKRMDLERAVKAHREALLAWRIVEEIPFPENGTEEQHEIWSERRDDAFADVGVTRTRLVNAALAAYPGRTGGVEQ